MRTFSTTTSAPAPSMTTPASDLAALSRRLGDASLDAAILGEGNTSIRVDDATFLVKASGSNLATLGEDDLVRLRFDAILPLLSGSGPVAEAQLAATYQQAKVDQASPRRPSVETVFHAALLRLPGVAVVAHTHPTAINMLTTSARWREHLDGRLFPDEVVVLGEHSAFVPYIDPGVELARAILASVNEVAARTGSVPRTVYMQNHGFIALAKNPTDAWNITLMAIKAARIRLGAIQAGGFNTLGEAVARHLKNRPDEKYREALLAQQQQ